MLDQRLDEEQEILIALKLDLDSEVKLVDVFLGRVASLDVVLYEPSHSALGAASLALLLFSGVEPLVELVGLVAVNFDDCVELPATLAVLDLVRLIGLDGE